MYFDNLTILGFVVFFAVSWFIMSSHARQS